MADRLTLADPARVIPFESPKPVAPSPEIHAWRVVPEFGDWYGVCACQARSLPFALKADAARWACPRFLAEEEVALDAALYAQRVKDASLMFRG
jgi:hypothetical protein